MILSAVLNILSTIFHCYSAQSFLIATVREAAQPFCKMIECGAPGGVHNHFVKLPSEGVSARGGRQLTTRSRAREQEMAPLWERGREEAHGLVVGVRGEPRGWGAPGSVGWVDRWV
jgi:hypothetical protein